MISMVMEIKVQWSPEVETSTGNGWWTRDEQMNNRHLAGWLWHDKYGHCKWFIIFIEAIIQW